MPLMACLILMTERAQSIPSNLFCAQVRSSVVFSHRCGPVHVKPSSRFASCAPSRDCGKGSKFPGGRIGPGAISRLLWTARGNCHVCNRRYIDWYQSEGASGTPTTGDLMLGVYPFAFVLEMRHKLGAMFFMSCTLNWAERYLIWPRTGDLPEPRSASRAERSTTYGTMLPDRPLNISPNLSFERLFDDSWEAASDKEVAEMDN